MSNSSLVYRDAPVPIHPARLLWDEYCQYDLNGNLVAKLVGTVGSGTITDGSATAYEYDALNRLVKVKHNYAGVNDAWPIASISISNASVSYECSGGSSLKTEMDEPSGLTSSYAYDAQGRLTDYTPPMPANYAVHYEYNNAGDKTAVVLRYQSADKYQTLYSYFRNGWLKQVRGQEWVEGAWANRVQVDYGYDELGRVTARTNADSDDVVTTYAYNDRGETMGVTHNKTSDLYTLIYTRDGAGNPLEIAFGGDEFDEAYTYGDRVRYGYDALSRLTNENWGHLNAGSWFSDHSDTWAYDWVGNRDPSSNTYNQADMLNVNDGHVYDYRGNLEYKPYNSTYPRTRFYYNPDNLLDRVDDVVDAETTNTTYITWDADQQRLRLTCGSDTWEMVYDPSAAIPAVMFAKNHVDSFTSHVFYVREPDGGLLASFDDSQAPNTRYYHFDCNGSSVLVTDGSGTAVGTFTYGAWGSMLNTPPDEWQPYQYEGAIGYYTHTSGQGAALAHLKQLGVRFYDGATGRFTQRDALTAWDEPYAYAGLMPTQMVDPSGLLICRCWTSKATEVENRRFLLRQDKKELSRTFLYNTKVGGKIGVDGKIKECIGVSFGVECYREYDWWRVKYKVWRLYQEAVIEHDFTDTYCEAIPSPVIWPVAVRVNRVAGASRILSQRMVNEHSIESVTQATLRVPRRP